MKCYNHSFPTQKDVYFLNAKINKFGLSTAKLIVTALCCLLSILSLFFVYANNGETFDYFYCLATIPFVCLPTLLSIIFKWKLNLGFYIIFSLYALGPLLGAVYALYYITWWWDDLLHALAGVIFAICGAYIAIILNKNGKTHYLLSALFGLFFSMGIAVLWELFEYSADMLLGSDMQADTVVNYLATKVGRSDGGLTIFECIQNVVIDGKSLGLGGYLDIGLIDTVSDMAVEALGGILYLIYAVIDRERHPLILRIKNHQ